MAGRWPAGRAGAGLPQRPRRQGRRPRGRAAGSARVTSGPRADRDPARVSQVAELINGLVKALRAYHMYLPNNPIYQRASDNLRIAFQPIWAVLDELVLTVAETDFVWEEQVVYHQLNKTRERRLGAVQGRHALAHDPPRRGARGAAPVPRDDQPGALPPRGRRRRPADPALGAGVRVHPVPVHRVLRRRRRRVPEQTGTLRPPAADAEAGGAAIGAPRRPRRRRRGPRAWSTSRSSTRRSTSSTSARSTRWPRPVEDEYRRDVRVAALNVLFDLFELQGEQPIRGEILGTLEALFPNFLNARDFRTAATVLREMPRCSASARQGSRRRTSARLDGFVAKLSEPAIVSQLVQSLDEAPALAGEATVGRGAAGAPRHGAGADPDLDSEPRPRRRSGRLLEGVADRLAEAHPARGAADPALARVRGARGGGGALRPAPAASRRCPAWARPWRHRDPAVRLASVQALAQLGTPAALALHREGARGRRPRRSAWPRCASVGGARLQGRASAGSRAWCSGKAVEGDGPHREDGVLRGLRRDRRAPRDSSR